ncbi:MAG: hypothetical protein SR1Q5_06710 [Quinella sp. 1Q5]|nr:hypothetical protein [Quinella sp. 1Q5]
MTFIKEIFLGREKLFTLNVVILHVALFAMSFAFVYVFSYSTSFGYDLLGGDSSIFQVIGKYWTQGYLPYVDLFDHKGPLIFFINAIGYIIYPRSGIMVPQIISLYLSCLFMWRAMELYSSSVWKIFFLLLTLIYYAAHYEEGNHIEEYSVLFLSSAVYCFLCSLKEDKFPPLYAFIYGVGFGGCLLLRLSDAAQICCQSFLVALFLLQARDFKTLWQNGLSFLAGFVIICLPFVIYFAAHDALYDMIYGTILLNLNYTIDETFHLPPVFREIHALIHYLPFFIMVIVSLFGLKENPKSRLLQSGLVIGAAIAFMLINLRPSDQYAMIFLAVAPILFAVLHVNYDTLQKILQASKFSFKRLFIQLLIILTVIHLYILTFHLKGILFVEDTQVSFLFSTYSKKAELQNSNERQNILALQALIPDAERKSFVIWGNFCTGAHWILQTNIVPRERLFMNTGQCAKLDPGLRQEYFDNLHKDFPLWILYGGESPLPYDSNNDSELEQVLAEKYSLKGEVSIYPQLMKLYRLKD